jgi:hypothetical protein
MDAAQAAELVRAACLEAAAAAYEDAGVQGLCAEGRWEAALGALQRLDVSALLRDAASTVPPSTTPGE